MTLNLAGVNNPFSPVRFASRIAKYGHSSYIFAAACSYFLCTDYVAERVFSLYLFSAVSLTRLWKDCSSVAPKSLMDEETGRIIRRILRPIAMVTLLALQCFVVLFVALHNWIPLGTLNNIKGVRQEFPTSKLVVTTLINITPVAIGLAATVFYFGRGYPGWVFGWLWITYGLVCYGSFTSWWMPYLLRPDPQRAARYRTMYAGTHAFLPERNGIRPNTLHVLFDIVTVAILIDLAVLTA